MTLKELCDKLGIHPYDLTGDDDFADSMMNEDITETIFYKELLAECNGVHNTQDELFNCVSCSLLFVGGTK